MVSPFWAWPLGNLGFAPRDLDSRSVLLDIRFLCVYPPPCTFWGGLRHSEVVFWGVWFFPPLPVFPMVSKAQSY